MKGKKLKKLINEAGGARVIAESLKVTRQAVEHWYVNGVPPRKAPKLAKLIGVTPADINPDIFGDVA